jgi:hypothetical protein
MLTGAYVTIVYTTTPCIPFDFCSALRATLEENALFLQPEVISFLLTDPLLNFELYLRLFAHAVNANKIGIRLAKRSRVTRDAMRHRRNHEIRLINCNTFGLKPVQVHQ